MEHDSNHEILFEIKHINQLLNDLQKDSEYTIISTASVALRDNAMQRKRTLIKEYVDNIHKSKISPPTDKVMYYITRANGHKLRAKTLDSLYDKLFVAYGGELSLNNTFGKLFEDALAERAQIREKETIDALRINFSRFFTQDFINKPIHKITANDLRKQTVEMIKRVKPISSAYTTYKTILNMVFAYAVTNNYVEVNIVKMFEDKDLRALCPTPLKDAEKKAMSPEQVRAITKEIYSRIDREMQFGRCLTAGFMVLLSTLTGMRTGEMCALKWQDIDYDKNRIHIHAQQQHQRKVGYVYVGWTKNEKGVSKGGRYFPLTDEIKNLLEYLKQCQKIAGICSDFVFCDRNNEWIHKDTCYDKFLNRLCKKLGYSIQNNHAIRMYFNSYVLIPKGVVVTNRAKLLGHSVEVNLKYYSFEDYNYCDRVCELLNLSSQVSTGVHENVVPFIQQNTQKAL